MPVNQLMMMKLLVNQTLYSQGLHATPGARHGVRRHRAPHRRGLRLSAARRRGRLPRGGARARRAVRRRRALDLQGVALRIYGGVVALMRASSPLCRALPRAFPSRPFAVRFWDGGAVAATEPDSPTFFVRRAVGAGALPARARLARTRSRLRRRLAGRRRSRRGVRGRRRVGAAGDQRGRSCAPGGWRSSPRRSPAASRARPSLELILRGRAAQHRARRSGRALPLRRRQRVLRAVPRRVDDLQLRDLLARRADARRRPSRPSSI